MAYKQAAARPSSTKEEIGKTRNRCRSTPHFIRQEAR
jgi:hypothetical protein